MKVTIYLSALLIILTSFSSLNNYYYVGLDKDISCFGSTTTNKVVSKVIVKGGNLFVVYTSSELKQLTFNGSDSEPILVDTNIVIFLRKKENPSGQKDMPIYSIMAVNISDLKERIIQMKCLILMA